jgi:ATP:ADP antiporter, AAA family
MAPTRWIRRDDMAPGALLSVHLFLSVASTVVGKAARDAIFLTRYTPLQMTTIDLATMVAVAVVVAVQLRAKAHVSTKRMLLISPLCFAVGDVALWLAMVAAPDGWITRATYVWIGVQASLGTPQASVLAYHVLSLRQARRLCGIVGTGAILGWIGGGLLAETLSARFGASSLLLGAAALTACSPLVVLAAWRRRCGTPPDVYARGRSEAAGGLQRSASLVWTSPALRAIACLALVSCAVTTIAGLQFKVIASESIGSTDRLAAFFGSFSVYAGLVALATQLLFTSRIFGALPLGTALVIAPAALAAGSVGILFSGTLAAAVFLKGGDQVLRHSVDRAAVDTLYRPLSAREIFEGKTFVDALVCRLGDAIGGAIALFSVTVLHLSFSSLSVISLGLLTGWIVSAAVARRGYGARLLDNLRGRDPSTEHRVDDVAGVHRHPIDRNTMKAKGLLEVDSGVRLRTLRALTRARARRQQGRCDKKSLETALAAEIVGLAVLVETLSGSDAPSANEHDAAADAIERIARLLFLLSPDRYPDFIGSALRSGEPAQAAGALEYLDITLSAPHRQILVSLLERWPLAPV